MAQIITIAFVMAVPPLGMLIAVIESRISDRRRFANYKGSK